MLGATEVERERLGDVPNIMREKRRGVREDTHKERQRENIIR